MILNIHNLQLSSSFSPFQDKRATKNMIQRNYALLISVKVDEWGVKGKQSQLRYHELLFSLISKFPTLEFHECRQVTSFFFPFFLPPLSHGTFSHLSNRCLPKLLMPLIRLQTDRPIDLGLCAPKRNHDSKPVLLKL